MKVVFTKAAQSELDEIIEYYNNLQFSLGGRFLELVVKGLNNIKEYPNAWPGYSKFTR